LKPFHFKEFTVHQSHAALKVGTDAMVLGALANAVQPTSVLDIGTGTGVLALMMAQKFSNATITAIDIDGEALKDCKSNFEASSWSERMRCFEQDFNDFSWNAPFDLIVCNPPFYEGALAGKEDRLNAAKHATNDLLPSLFETVKRLLSSTGVFWVILPFENFDNWKVFARTKQLYVQEKIEVQSKPGIPKRIVASFVTDEKVQASASIFVIRNVDNSFTKEYIKATKSFHSKKM